MTRLARAGKCGFRGARGSTGPPAAASRAAIPAIAEIDTIYAVGPDGSQTIHRDTKIIGFASDALGSEWKVYEIDLDEFAPNDLSRLHVVLGFLIFPAQEPLAFSIRNAEYR